MMPQNIKTVYSENFEDKTGEKLKFIVYSNGTNYLLKLGHEEETEEQIFNKLDLGEKYFNTLQEAKDQINQLKDII